MISTPDVQPAQAWTDALFGFKLSLQSQHRSEGTIRNRLCSSTIMARHATAVGLDDPAAVTFAWMARYLSDQYSQRRGGGPCSLFADLAAFWTWYSADYETGNPMEKIRRPREVMTDVPVLTDEQIAGLMKATAGTDSAKVRDRAILLLLLDSGIRRMELAQLDCSDVDLESGLVRVRHGKGNKPRTALIGSATAQAVWKYLRSRADASGNAPLFLSIYGHRLTPSGVGQLIGKIGRQAGIDGLRPHIFRHSWASRNLDDGIAEHSLAKLAGWSTVKQVARYGAALAEERALREGRRHLPVDQLGKPPKAS